uniref:Uncharacterized protein n=1 Tax=Anguilla anguilla TaxID=7936 RepID=A0A0E9VJ20_ANGAN
MFLGHDSTTPGHRATKKHFCASINVWKLSAAGPHRGFVEGTEEGRRKTEGAINKRRGP